MCGIKNNELTTAGYDAITLNNPQIITVNKF